jgi:diguanylate cyclase (GGDEF)-like protein
MGHTPGLRARLEFLARLGQRLPSALGAEAAAAEVVDALDTLGLGSIVAALEGDVVVLQAAKARTVPGDAFPVEFATRLVGLRIPIDGIRSVRQTVRLRRTYSGPAGAVESLRGLMPDSATDSFSLDAGLSGWALAQGTAQNVPDATTHPFARQVPGTAVVKESLLLLPLVAGDRKLGIISCWRVGAGRFSARDLEAASLFAHVAASAWHNAQLYVELLNAAMTDPLTHLYNSRWLRDAAERDLRRAARDRQPVALLLLDLDHFKMVNDSAGHAAGDLLLQRVAMQLRAAVRGTDAVVRLGGEEFVVLLHAAGAEQAARVRESPRLAVRKVPMPRSCLLARLTVSVGVAAHPEHGLDLDQLLAAADRAMYAAKHAGRDHVAVAHNAEGLRDTDGSALPGVGGGGEAGSMGRRPDGEPVGAEGAAGSRRPVPSPSSRRPQRPVPATPGPRARPAPGTTPG